MRLPCGCCCNISADKLVEVLNTLPAGAHVEPNLVGNLKVLDGPEGTYIGWVDLRSEEYVPV